MRSRSAIVLLAALLCLLAAAPSSGAQEQQQQESGNSATQEVESGTLEEALAEIRAVVSNFTAWAADMQAMAADTAAATAANGTDVSGRDVTAQGGESAGTRFFCFPAFSLIAFYLSSLFFFGYVSRKHHRRWS